MTINASAQYPGAGGGNAPYTSLIAPDGTAFVTGIAYQYTHPGLPAETALIATFNALSAGSFSIYLLNGNQDGHFVGNTFVGLGVNGGAAVNTAAQYANVNEFIRYDITGALPTDSFQIYATTAQGQQPSLGGVTFSGAPLASSTPEPSSLLLLGTGIIGAAGAARRKFRS